MATSGSTKRRSPASELSRDAVIDHALDLADREGLDAVAIRRIANDFGVTPMALYWHVRNKDELLAAMGDRIYDSLDIPDVEGDWLEQVSDALQSLVNALRRHPGSVDLAMPRVLVSPPAQLLAERTLGALRGGRLLGSRSIRPGAAGPVDGDHAGDRPARRRVEHPTT